jgi:hypothetical protein
LSLLTEACELEHGLACSYLYSAFTLKQDLNEGGLDWRQLQKVRFWAAQLYFIAAQEMLHLAQVWNLQAAIGGTPYYLRPNFPQSSKYYSLDVPLRLQRFSLAALDRFIQFERPEDVELNPEGPLELAAPTPPAFTTVGQLYRQIAEGFETVPDVILGDPDRQVGPDLVDFPDLVRVTSVQDALSAISLITAQGEGIGTAHRDCHFEIFRTVRREYLNELTDAENRAAQQDSGGPALSDFKPARLAISDPAASEAPELGAVGANVIDDPVTADVADCFDSIYRHMLRMLQYVFDNATGHTPLLRAFGRGALEAMTAVLKPLGEALTRMPAGPEYQEDTAGPGFGLARHVALPIDPTVAAVVNAERFRDLSLRLSDLAAQHADIWQIKTAAGNLEELAQRFAALPGE